MFFVDSTKTVKAGENRYGMAMASMDGSVRFSLFLNGNYFSFKG